MQRRLFALLALVAFALAAAGPLIAQQPQPAKPDLIVVISIDQFRYEYLTRFEPYFSDGGFRRALKGGANFRHALYPYAVTFTGPGHAAIGTGTTPSRNGIVANTWFDRIAASPGTAWPTTAPAAASPP
jgi:predicted AlkP superfamily pyrophosphatase or phosphodiesterase